MNEAILPGDKSELFINKEKCLLILSSFLIGTCLASFVMVLCGSPGRTLWRRSTCDSCEKPLNWFQLIPVFSSLVFRNHCGQCNHRPSLIYGLVEIVVGFMFVITASLWSLGWVLTIEDIFILTGLHIILWDWNWRQIPIVDLVLLGILTGLYAMAEGRFPISSFVMFGFLTLLFLAWRLAGKNLPLASGDWILLIATAGWLAPQSLPVFLIMAGGLGIFTAIVYRKYHNTLYFPFAPAILVAAWICMVVLKIELFSRTQPIM